MIAAGWHVLRVPRGEAELAGDIAGPAVVGLADAIGTAARLKSMQRECQADESAALEMHDARARSIILSGGVLAGLIVLLEGRQPDRRAGL